MKTAYLFLALAMVPLALGRAQSPAPTPSVSTPAEPAPRKGALRGLTAEERGKLKAARRAAVNDPAVKAAEAQRSTNRKAYRQALRAAMVRSDPSIEAILSKMKRDRREKKIY